MRKTETIGLPRRRNVVFILADDLGWSDLRCYGADLHQTPNIDRLASQGMRFTNAYAAAPICSPSRAAIMTGKSPARLHMTIWFEASRRPPPNRRLVPPMTIGNLPHREVTVAEALKPAGYYTAHVGKWHLGDAAHYPQTQGFDANIGGTFWGAPPTYFFPYRGEFGRERELRYVPHLEGGRPGEYLTDRLTDEALKIIDRVKHRPFFLYLAYHTVHAPVEGKAHLVEEFRRKLKPTMHHRNPGYAAMVHSLDENVGRVLGKLKQSGLDKNTIVIFTSDNGGYINQYHGKVVTNNYPLRSGKGSLYEGGIRVPLIVRRPADKTGRTCDEPVTFTDFFPTILDLVGITNDVTPNAQRTGLSLRPLLDDPHAHLPREALYFHYPHYYPTTTPVGAIRAGSWKLLEYFEDNHVELYNLTGDPREQHDLSNNNQQVAARLRNKLHAWRKSVHAQMPVPNPKWPRTKRSRR